MCTQTDIKINYKLCNNFFGPRIRIKYGRETSIRMYFL